MKSHLSPEEFIEALDGHLGALRRDHLDHCDACRTELRSAEQLVADLSATAVPEPSPLFWDHLGDRVRTAVQAEGPVKTGIGWHWLWKPVVSLSAVAAAAFLAVQLRAPVSQQPGSAAGVGSAATDSAATVSLGVDGDEVPLDAVVAMAASLPADEAQGLSLAGAQTTMLIEDLTPDERSAFVTLLRQEMARLQ